MTTPSCPVLYQINTRVWLTALSRALGRAATLDDIPDTELDRFAALGFDWLWLMSVWQTGPAGQQISRSNPEWRKEFQDTLPDLREEDIGGSGFAVMDYTVHRSLGGDSALARLRERMKQRGLRLLLDFVPNHTALDHRWVDEHPEFYMPGTPQNLAQAPQNYCGVPRAGGELILAHGRDPYFPGWPDTLQLNYGNAATREAMTLELLKIAGQCDGVRCDMAMLVLPDVFQRTWGVAMAPFWPQAIERVRTKKTDFCFMAEVYWDLEWTLQQQGFDYTYDKRLCDRLHDGHAKGVREHLWAGLDYQAKLARFLENHDEPRAAAVFPLDVHKAAAVITYLTPGLRFFQLGQLEGLKKRVSPHLCRAPDEPADGAIQAFYERLLSVLRQPLLRDGRWQLLECEPAWEGNWTWDCYIAFAWEGNNNQRLLVAVNFAPNQSQCYVRLPWPELDDGQWRFNDLLGGASLDQQGSDLKNRGLYLDAGPWQASVFTFTRSA